MIRTWRVMGEPTGGRGIENGNGAEGKPPPSAPSTSLPGCPGGIYRPTGTMFGVIRVYFTTRRWETSAP